MKKVLVTVIAEAENDTVLNPADYTVRIKSDLDCYFDMYIESVTMQEVPGAGE